MLNLSTAVSSRQILRWAALQGCLRKRVLWRGCSYPCSLRIIIIAERKTVSLSLFFYLENIQVSFYRSCCLSSWPWDSKGHTRLACRNIGPRVFVFLFNDIIIQFHLIRVLTTRQNRHVYNVFKNLTARKFSSHATIDFKYASKTQTEWTGNASSDKETAVACSELPLT